MSESAAILQKKGLRNLLSTYWHQHTLAKVVGTVALNGRSRTALELARYSAQLRLRQRLEKQFAFPLAEEPAPLHPLAQVPADVIWTMWLDGMEQAPAVVKRCHRSLLSHFGQQRVVTVTKDNLGDYVQLPDFINKKYENGLIPAAQFSDIVRTELLATYGGTWIDSTVFVSSDLLPDSFVNSNFFVFQNLKPGRDGDPLGVSNWFIHSCARNEIMLGVRQCLFEYWRANNRLLDYFIYHFFLRIVIDRYERAGKGKVPKFSNAPAHVLLLEWTDAYDLARYQEILAMSPVHKLTYKDLPNEKTGAETLFSHWLQGQD